jgi:hypothetical protein
MVNSVRHEIKTREADKDQHFFFKIRNGF